MKNGTCGCFEQDAQIKTFAWEMGEDSLKEEIWKFSDPSGLDCSLQLQ